MVPSDQTNTKILFLYQRFSQNTWRHLYFVKEYPVRRPAGEGFPQANLIGLISLEPLTPQIKRDEEKSSTRGWRKIREEQEQAIRSLQVIASPDQRTFLNDTHCVWKDLQYYSETCRLPSYRAPKEYRQKNILLEQEETLWLGQLGSKTIVWTLILQS